MKNSSQVRPAADAIKSLLSLLLLNYLINQHPQSSPLSHELIHLLYRFLSINLIPPANMKFLQLASVFAVFTASSLAAPTPTTPQPCVPSLQAITDLPQNFFVRVVVPGNADLNNRVMNFQPSGGSDQHLYVPSSRRPSLRLPLPHIFGRHLPILSFLRSPRADIQAATSTPRASTPRPTLCKAVSSTISPPLPAL